MKQSLTHHLEHGIPFSDFELGPHKTELDALVDRAIDTSLEAHALLQASYINKDWDYFATLDDEFSGESAKYLTQKNGWGGRPLFAQWDPANPATDIGIRAIHPKFQGRANRTTIIHADSQAPKDFEWTFDGPHPTRDAILALAALNKFVVARIVKPFLNRVADLDGVPKQDYQELFYPADRRAATLTRCIMYHTVKNPTLGPVGGDGEPLLIKEHCDQSSYTVDVHQTSSGLQYNVSGDWVDAGTDPAIFRGAADDFRDQSGRPALHRVVETFENQWGAAEKLRAKGIGRISLVTFVGPSGEHARPVRPNSAATHPTEARVDVMA
jgi:hypothetical protein